MKKLRQSIVCITAAIALVQLSYAPIAAAANCPAGETFVPHSALIEAGMTAAPYPGACVPIPNAIIVPGCPKWLTGWGFAAGVVAAVAGFVALTVVTGGTAWGVAALVAHVAGGQAFAIGLGCLFGATFRDLNQVRYG